MSSERIRGRKAVTLRRARLTAEPLCRDCKAKGIIRASTVPDHIIPLDHGGTEDGQVVSLNIQCLCTECHDRKTRNDFGWKEKRTIGPDGWPVE